jgi:hypothetical protein
MSFIDPDGIAQCPAASTGGSCEPYNENLSPKLRSAWLLDMAKSNPWDSTWLNASPSEAYASRNDSKPKSSQDDAYGCGVLTSCGSGDWAEEAVLAGVGQTDLPRPQKR